MFSQYTLLSLGLKKAVLSFLQNLLPRSCNTFNYGNMNVYGWWIALVLWSPHDEPWIISDRGNNQLRRIQSFMIIWLPIFWEKETSLSKKREGLFYENNWVLRPWIECFPIELNCWVCLLKGSCILTDTFRVKDCVRWRESALTEDELISVIV